MNSLAWKSSNNTFCQKIESKIAQNVKYPNFYPNRRLFWICPFFGGGQGHPGFQTFFNVFFENGIKRYQVTNLSGVHNDLKLWPSIAHLYCHLRTPGSSSEFYHLYLIRSLSIHGWFCFPLDMRWGTNLSMPFWMHSLNKSQFSSTNLSSGLLCKTYRILLSTLI